MSQMDEPREWSGVPDQSFRQSKTLDEVLAGAEPFDAYGHWAIPDLTDEEWKSFTAALAE
ncbi:MAG: hypothetical protein ACRC35_00060 [Angustibacter sp.]